MYRMQVYVNLKESGAGAKSICPPVSTEASAAKLTRFLRVKPVVSPGRTSG